MKEYSLGIGIVELRPAWKSLLMQLGLNFEEIRFSGELRPTDYAVIIVNRKPSPAEQETLASYIDQGGSLLDTGFLAAPFFAKTPQPTFTRTLFPFLENNLFKHIDLIDIFSTTFTIREAPLLAGNAFFERRGYGHYGFLGFEVDKLLLDSRAMQKEFYLETDSRRLPSERVARVSRGGIVKVIGAMLESLFYRRELPFIFKWHFPSGYQNIFAFRVDTDFSSKEQIQAYYQVARRHNMRMSWFLHVEAHQKWLGDFHHLRDQEYAVHCFRHHTYEDYAQNAANLARARELMEAERLPFEGFAAPYGIWNNGLDRAIREARFLYSSEFSLAYDTLPFYPVVDNQLSPVLQLPVHPISVGTLKRARVSSAEMARYLRRQVNIKIANSDPLLFYDHPNHDFPEVPDALFTYIRHLRVPNVNFSTFARYWRKRDRSRFKAVLAGNELLLDSDDIDPAVQFMVYRDWDHQALLPQTGAYPLNRTAWEERKRALWSREAAKAGRQTLRLRKQSWLNRYWRYKNLRKQETESSE